MSIYLQNWRNNLPFDCDKKKTKLAKEKSKDTKYFTTNMREILCKNIKGQWVTSYNICVIALQY